MGAAGQAWPLTRSPAPWSPSWKSRHGRTWSAAVCTASWRCCPSPRGRTASRRYHRAPLGPARVCGGQRAATVGGGSRWGQRLLPLQSLHLDTMQALEDLLKSVLRRDLTPRGLQTTVEVRGGAVCARGRRGRLAAGAHLFLSALLAWGRHSGPWVLPATLWGLRAGVHVGAGPDPGGAWSLSPVPSASCRLDAEMLQELQV